MRCFFCRYEEFVKKERKNVSPDEEVMASSSEQKLTLVRRERGAPVVPCTRLLLGRVLTGRAHAAAVTAGSLLNMSLIVSTRLHARLRVFVSMMLCAQHYTWEEKYRPRKPRFFNRVRTGYSWNKYNMTHYDHDNPPPKVVQGYKFNIFYPDLIDKTKAPTWFLEPSDTADNTIIIRFHAGPPYEDVAFKILNQEWELERFRGFRNIFDRGIMQLYFNFKRHVYRR